MWGSFRYKRGTGALTLVSFSTFFALFIDVVQRCGKSVQKNQQKTFFSECGLRICGTVIRRTVYNSPKFGADSLYTKTKMPTEYVKKLMF